MKWKVEVIARARARKMRKNYLRWYTWYTLILIFVLVLGNGIISYAQTTESGAMSLPEYIKVMGLSKDKLEQTMKLTRDFLSQLQSANVELTKLMAPQEPGSKPDPKVKEKLVQLKQRFGVQMNKYHVDLEKLLGATKALRIAEKIHIIIPQILIEGLKMPGMSPYVKTTFQEAAPTPTKPASTTPTPNVTVGSNKVNTILTGLTSSATNIPASINSTTAATQIVTPTPISPGASPLEVPLGSPGSDVAGSTGVSSSTGSSSNLDLQIVGNSSSSSGKGMDGMDGMMSMMGGMMGNMSNSNNNQAANGLDQINRQLVLQLLSNNAAIIQMLATLSYQVGNENLPLLLQPIYQLLANQASLIQMLYSNFNTTMANGSSSSGGMGMM